MPNIATQTDFYTNDTLQIFPESPPLVRHNTAPIPPVWYPIINFDTLEVDDVQKSLIQNGGLSDNDLRNTEIYDNLDITKFKQTAYRTATPYNKDGVNISKKKRTFDYMKNA